MKLGDSMDELVPKLNESLVLDFSDLNLAGDWLSFGIDSVLKSNILNEIPVVQTVLGVGKAVLNIRERNSVKNLAIFLIELNSGNIDKDKLNEYREKLNNDPKTAEKELGRVLIILDQVIDNEKASILGKLYRAHINQEIDWDLLVEFSEITNRLFIKDIELLYFMWKKDDSGYKEEYEDRFRVDRIYSLGIVGNIMPTYNEVWHLHGKVLNALGQKYCNIIFND